MSASKLHSLFTNLLNQYNIPEYLTPLVKKIIIDKITDNSVCVKDDIAVLRKKLSTIEKDMKECRLRYASGKIDDETFSIAIQEFEERKGEILLGIEKYETELSNSQMQ